MRVRKCCGEPGTLSEPRLGGGRGGDPDTYLKIQEFLFRTTK